MDDYTVQLVRESFDLVEPIAPKAAALFYTHLVTGDPAVVPLLNGDLIGQGDRLMQTMALVVAKLDAPEVLAPLLQTLAQRLAAKGVRDVHYAAAGTALLKMLHQTLGVAYTDEVEDAWTTAYAEIAATMREAAKATA